MKNGSMFENDLKAWEDWAEGEGFKRFHGRQISAWIDKRFQFHPKEMTDLSKPMREKLLKQFPQQGAEIFDCVEDHEAVKYLVRFADGHSVETVKIKGKDKYTLCVSTQVGCALACQFCASGRHGCLRNLTPGEIVAQVLLVCADDKRLHNLVVMGMGEPFMNYDNLMAALSRLRHQDGLNLGGRRITVSTAGMVPEIYRFAREGGQMNLAISLNAAIDELRSRIMPINQVFNLERLKDAAQFYITQSKRRLSLEYIVIEEINDQWDDVSAIKDFFPKKLCHLNLIVYNPTGMRTFKHPSKERVREFARRLESTGVPVSIRQSKGTSITGACGQLQSIDTTE